MKSKLKKVLLSLSMLPSFALAQSSSCEFSQPFSSELVYGWIPDATHLCGGYYAHPAWPENLESAWKISADDFELIQQGDSKLAGDVLIQYGARRLEASQVILSRQDDRLVEIRASQGIRYFDPDSKIEGSKAYWNAALDKVTVEEPTYYYFPRHARGKAKVVMVEGQRKLILQNASYTTCSPHSTTWRLQGQRIELDKLTGQGRAQNIRLMVKDVSVFYWPYLQFPIDNKRHTGFLFPHVGSTTQSGLEFAWPFYWNIAPQMDATLTPRILSNRGTELQSEFRYLGSKYNGTFQANLLPNDRRYREFREENRLSPPIQAVPYDPRLTALDHGNHRFGMRSFHHTRWNEHWSSELDFTYAGDDNYFYDLENSLQSASTTKLNQEVNLRYNGLHWQHIWRLQSHQLLHPLLGPINQEEYSRLPQWAFQGYYPNLSFGLDFELDGEAAHFNHRTDPWTGTKPTEGQRYHLKPGLMLPLENWSGFIKPRVQLDALGYHLVHHEANNTGRPTTPSRVIPIIDVDTGLYFDKYYEHGKHTIEPRIYYLYVPYQNQDAFPNFDTSPIDLSYYSMFRDNRFTGRDRLQDTHQTTFAISSRFLNTRGQERARMTVGEIVYFRERRTSLCAENNAACIAAEDPYLKQPVSPLIAHLVITPSQEWYLASGLDWDMHDETVDKGYMSTYYSPTPNQVIQLSYFWMRRDPFQVQDFLKIRPLHQVDTAFVLPLHRRWDWIGQARYDIENQRLIELLGGLEYDSCCFALQLTGNRYLRPNDGISKPEYAHGVFFQILFKGLSSFGSSSTDHKLMQSIPFYKPFEKRNQFKKKNLSKNTGQK
jgi:LPS-assembly protein